MGSRDGTRLKTLTRPRTQGEPTYAEREYESTYQKSLGKGGDGKGGKGKGGKGKGGKGKEKAVKEAARLKEAKAKAVEKAAARVAGVTVTITTRLHVAITAVATNGTTGTSNGKLLHRLGRSVDTNKIGMAMSRRGSSSAPFVKMRGSMSTFTRATTRPHAITRAATWKERSDTNA